jgi:hypothetical protein
MNGLKSTIMYIASYVLSIVNFIGGFFLMLLLVGYIVLFQSNGLTPKESIVYGMSIIDGYTEESRIAKDEELLSKNELRVNFANANMYRSSYDLGEITITIVDVNYNREQLEITDYSGNHQNDAIVKSYYDDHLANIAEFSKSIGDIRVVVNTVEGAYLGTLYKGVLVEDTRSNKPFKLEVY